jgi:hypothetical protein
MIAPRSPYFVYFPIYSLPHGGRFAQSSDDNTTHFSIFSFAGSSDDNTTQFSVFSSADTNFWLHKNTILFGSTTWTGLHNMGSRGSKKSISSLFSHGSCWQVTILSFLYKSNSEQPSVTIGNWVMYLILAKVQRHMARSVAVLQKNKHMSNRHRRCYRNKQAVPTDQWGSHSLICWALEIISTKINSEMGRKLSIACMLPLISKSQQNMEIKEWLHIRNLSSTELSYHFEEWSMPRPLQVSIIPLNLERYS